MISYSPWVDTKSVSRPKSCFGKENFLKCMKTSGISLLKFYRPTFSILCSLVHFSNTLLSFLPHTETKIRSVNVSYRRTETLRTDYSSVKKSRHFLHSLTPSVYKCPSIKIRLPYRTCYWNCLFSSIGTVQVFGHSPVTSTSDHTHLHLLLLLSNKCRNIQLYFCVMVTYFFLFWTVLLYYTSVYV